MPANLDAQQQQLILTVTTCVTILIAGSIFFVEFFLLPLKNDVEMMPSRARLASGCLKTLCWMIALTAVLTWPITRLKNDIVMSVDDLSSSINFCEADFEHTPFVAEPANTLSSIVAYIPLGLTGIYLSPSRRFTVCYISLVMIGIGSTLLHALLTAISQGGDELPMLWYTAAAGYCALDIILGGSSWLGSVIAASVVAATAVYLQNRQDFTFFYIMFSVNANSLVVSLLWITLGMNWTKYPNGDTFRRVVLIPMATTCGWILIAAVWVWVSEMIFCHHAVNGSFNNQIIPFIWNRVVHPMWHFLSGLLAFLLIQVFIAASGFAAGKGIPSIQWRGAPCIVFPAK